MRNEIHLVLWFWITQYAPELLQLETSVFTLASGRPEAPDTT